MKRVKAACITQTLHFFQKDDIERDYAAKMVEEDKAGLDKTGTKYRILSEETLEDGSVMIEIKKQYNTSSVGNYLDE